MGDSTTTRHGDPLPAAASAPLSATQLGWLWRLAQELLACDSAEAAEHLAARAERELADLDGGPALAAALAETVGPALANARDRDRLRSLAIRDPLTGLLNRRSMAEELQRQIDAAARLGRPLAVALLDLDRFRDFNQRHGHRAGDMALQMVGLLIEGFRHASDVACRYGGEEFVVIMPHTTAAEAGDRLERLRAALAGLTVHHEGRPLEPVTASIGVAEFPLHGTTVAALVDAADGALYRGKDRGRNRICLAAVAGDARPRP